MTRSRRWARPLADHAIACRIRLPWERGLRRSAFVSRRRAPEASVRFRRVA